MPSSDGRISPELSSCLAYLDLYMSCQDSKESRFLEEAIISCSFPWRQLVDESQRSPPSKQRLKETIASIYFGNLDDTPKPLSHWLFTLETQQEFAFLRDLSPTLDLNTKDAHGNSALHCAVYNKNPDVIPHLLARGANPNLANHAGDCPIHLAVHRDTIEALEVLKTLASDPRTDLECVDRAGYTPLKRAVLRKQFGCVVALTAAGARVDSSLIQLARSSLSGDYFEGDMIQHLMLTKIKQNMSDWKPKAFAFTASLITSSCAFVAGLYLTGVLQEGATTYEGSLPNSSQNFEEYFE